MGSFLLLVVLVAVTWVIAFQRGEIKGRVDMVEKLLQIEEALRDNYRKLVEQERNK